MVEGGSGQQWLPLEQHASLQGSSPSPPCFRGSFRASTLSSLDPARDFNSNFPLPSRGRVPRSPQDQERADDRRQLTVVRPWFIHGMDIDRFAYSTVHTSERLLLPGLDNLGTRYTVDSALMAHGHLAPCSVHADEVPHPFLYGGRPHMAGILVDTRFPHPVARPHEPSR